MRDESNNKNKVWSHYEQGREYNNTLSPNQYNLVNTNLDFYSGNQWRNIKETPAMSRLARPTFNIIKRICSLFVASLTSSNTTINFDSLSYYDGNNENDPSSNAAEMATAEVRNLLEKFKIDYRIRDALTDGAITGDYCAHFYWDSDALPYGGAFGLHRGEIKMELVDGINVMFGNPNTPDVESQPYILIIGRDTVEHLKAEAEQFRKSGEKRGGNAADSLDIDALMPDSEWQWQGGIGGKTEISPRDDKNGKALYVYMYTKVTEEETVMDKETGLPKREPKTDDYGNPIPMKNSAGEELTDTNGDPVYEMRDVKVLKTSVHVTKATRNMIIFEDVDTGLSRYPIAWGNWERQKNQYHGRALVTGIVPNQIFINSMMAMIFRHLQLQSFPKTIYNADLISQWNNELGVALGVHNLQPGQDLRSVATTLQPADMSNQIVMCIDKVMQYTKDCLGATDAQMGNVRADNTSAIMVLQTASDVPLENIRANMHEWVEDIGAILLDMMGTYYGKRPIVHEVSMPDISADDSGVPIIDPVTGKMQTKKESHRIVEEFDFTQFKNLWLNVRADVGATTQYSEIAMVQTLDNLRREGTIDVIAYLERIPDKLVPMKQDLIEQLKQQQAQEAAAQMPQPQQQPPQGVAGPAMGGSLDPDKAISNLPTRIQNQYNNLPNSVQQTLVGVGRQKAE